MEGESVGIIGMNGAGKTTLLKILSDILRPTSGEVRIRGQLAAILEIGVGFHQELSGRENIFLYGKMLGFSNSQIRSKFDEILEFSEITDFIDTPIKHYSSGMIMRLGFAIIASLDTDIILLDEMLAVGDVHFRTKCLNKILEMKNDNRTIVIVGHDMNQISNYCDKLFLLDKGKLIDSGPPKTIINKYQQILLHIDDMLNNNTKWNEYRNDNQQTYNKSLEKLKTHFEFDHKRELFKSNSFKLLSVEIYSADYMEVEQLEFDIEKEIQVHIKAKYFSGKADLGFFIADMMNNRLFGDAVFKDKAFAMSEGTYDFVWTIPAHLLNEGIYTMGVMMFDDKYNPINSNMDLLTFATIDKNKSLEDFSGLYIPMKPKIEFSFKTIG